MASTQSFSSSRSITLVSPAVLLHSAHLLIVLVEGNGPSSRLKIILMAIITFLWSSQTVVVGLKWKAIDECFITHGLSLDMELSFYQSGAMPGGITSNVLRVLIDICADIVLVSESN